MATRLWLEQLTGRKQLIYNNMANTKSLKLVKASTQYVNIASASCPNLSITGDITIEAWVKFTSLEANATPVHKHNGDDGGYYLIAASSGTKLQCHIEASNGTDVIDITSTNAIFSTDTWYHVAVSVDVSASTGTMYLNGSSISAGVTGSATSIGTNTNNFTIGGANVGVLLMNGLVDEVRIWDDIRTAQEISDNYDKVLDNPGSEANLQGYWQMEDDLTDSSSNGYTLTNNNSATFNSDVPFSGANTLVVDTMALSFTYNDVTLAGAHKLAVDTMSLSFTFNDVELTGPGNKLAVDTMALSFTFNDVTLTYARALTLSVDTMALDFTFNDVEFCLNCVLSVDTMALNFTFNDVTLTYTEVLKLQVDTMPLIFTFNDTRLKVPIRWINQTKNTSVWTNQDKS